MIVALNLLGAFSLGIIFTCAMCGVFFAALYLIENHQRKQRAK